MKFGMNFSMPARDLVEKGQIEVDVYKTTNHEEMVAKALEQRPAYVHFGLMAGSHNLEAVGIDTIEHYLKWTGTPYVNTHIAPRAIDFDIPLDTRDPAHTEMLAEAILQDAEQMKSIFGADNVILENAPWDPTPKYAIPLPVIEPDFISRIVRESGCGFLLDLAHARCSALYLHRNEKDYVNALPLDRIREMHITGVRWVDAEDRYVDHFPMTEGDWQITEWAFDNIASGQWPAPWAAVSEYGGYGPNFGANSDPAVMLAEMPRLYHLAHGVKESR